MTCTKCLRHEPAFVRTHVAFDYAYPWDGLVQQLKFGGRTELAKPLGAALAHSLLQAWGHPSAGEAPVRVSALLPVPLSPARLAERGYNQSLLLARELARITAVPLDGGALLRPIERPHQAELPREQRIQNLRGVFMVDPAARARLQGQRVALVDDVITTGSTAAEATRELLRAGVQAVEVWAVARTAHG